MLINKDKYIIGNLSDVETFDEFEKFVKECESTTKTWSLDLQYCDTWEQFFEDGQKNFQNIVVFNKKKEMVALWTFMFDVPARAVETSTIVKEGHRGEKLGLFLNLIGERYVKANWGEHADNIFGRVMIPENQRWAATLCKYLNYRSLDIFNEPGIIFVGKQINSFFLPRFFNKQPDDIVEMNARFNTDELERFNDDLLDQKRSKE